MRISFSRLSTRQRCDYLYDMKYNRNLQPVYEKPAPLFGKVVHAVIEQNMLNPLMDSINREIVVDEQIDAYIESITAPDLLNEDMFTNDVDIDNKIAEAEAMKPDAYQVVEMAVEAIKPWEWEPLKINGAPVIEKEFVLAGRTSAGNYYEFVGVVDLAATHLETGYTWIIDWKSRAKIKDEEQEGEIGADDLQKAVYQFLMMMNGHPVTGSRIGQIKSKPPGTPRVNKDGTVSRAAVDTTWERYKQVVIDAGEDPADYDDMEAKLEGKTWFQWITNIRSEESIIRMWDYIIEPAIDRIFAGVTEPIPVRSWNWACSQCEMKNLCLAELHDNAVDPTMYGVKEKEG